MKKWIMREYLNEKGSEWMIGLLREIVNNWVSGLVMKCVNNHVRKRMSEIMRVDERMKKSVN